MIDLDLKEQALNERAKRLEEREKEIQAKEKALKLKEKQKKQIILRIAPSLWADISQWAEDDFRSINAQIEFILSKAVKERKK